MNKIKNMRLRNKLILMLIFPMVGLLYFSVGGITGKLQISREMHSLKKLSVLSVKLSSLVHEIQKERGMTAGYLGSRGELFTAELTAQRQIADKQIGDLMGFLEVFSSAEDALSLVKPCKVDWIALLRLKQRERK